MCRFLTGPARIQQTDRKRVWKLLDNEIFKANDNQIYLTPRNLYTDNYTIPMWVAWIAGSPVDFDTRCSHLHDLWCYVREALIVNLTEEELREKGYLRYSDKNEMWICEDIPDKYLSKRKVGKFETNNMLYQCMEAAGVPLLNRIMTRIGVAFNIGWVADLWTGKVFVLELDKIYEESYWREHVKRGQ